MEENQEIENVIEDDFNCIVSKDRLSELVKHFVKAQENINEEEKRLLLLQRLYRFLNMVTSDILCSIKSHPKKTCTLLVVPKDLTEQMIRTNLDNYVDLNLLNLTFIQDSDNKLSLLKVGWNDNNLVILSIMHKNLIQ